MEVNRNKAFTALRVSHAKSLQDITELKRLRESVGKNIREACLLVDGHERDLTEHCENLKKTRESFSQFERRLSNATLSSLENSRIRRKYWDESINSCSSGDENGTVVNRRRYNRPTSVIVKPRCSLSDNDDWKSRRYSYCSDAQSLSSAYSYSPKSQRSNKLRQIVVPIYEDSFDSGVSLQTTSPRTTASRSVSSDVHGYRSKNNAKSNGFQDIKSYSSRGKIKIYHYFYIIQLFMITLIDYGHIIRQNPRIPFKIESLISPSVNDSFLNNSVLFICHHAAYNKLSVIIHI